MKIKIAKTDADILSCCSVMRELRPHINENEFLLRVRRQEEAGYRIVCAQDDQNVVTVAGTRILETLAWGRVLYVDDLITAQTRRSQGVGKSMLSWLKTYAKNQDCVQIHLDSGSHRKDAHRFYEREGMSAVGFHFSENL